MSTGHRTWYDDFSFYWQTAAAELEAAGHAVSRAHRRAAETMEAVAEQRPDDARLEYEVLSSQQTLHCIVPAHWEGLPGEGQCHHGTVQPQNIKNQERNRAFPQYCAACQECCTLRVRWVPQSAMSDKLTLPAADVQHRRGGAGGAGGHKKDYWTSNTSV